MDLGNKMNQLSSSRDNYCNSGIKFSNLNLYKPIHDVGSVFLLNDYDGVCDFDDDFCPNI